MVGRSDQCAARWAPVGPSCPEHCHLMTPMMITIGTNGDGAKCTIDTIISVAIGDNGWPFVPILMPIGANGELSNSLRNFYLNLSILKC